MKKIIVLIVVLLPLFNCSKKVPQFQNGDIIFQTSLSSQSQAIQLATHSKYSHMGIIYEENGNYYVFEAIQPVQLTKADKWIKRGKNGHFIVKRLKNSEIRLTNDVLKKMKAIGQEFEGKNYDLYFEWSDERVYCSELVWKIYKRALNIEIGKLQQIKDFDLSNPIVQSKMKERYGNNIPLNESVISPSQMYKSDELIEVYSN
jgi:hypothetical protein